MKIFLLGASGRTGRLILEQAIDQGHQVHILVTSPQKLQIQSDLLTVFTGSPQNREQVLEAMQGCEAVISTINILRQSEFPWSKLLKPEKFLSEAMANVVDVMQAINIDRVIISTAWGVAESLNEVNPAMSLIIKNSYIGIVYEDHERQEILLKNSGLNWTIIRPVSLTNSPTLKELRISIDGFPKPKSKISRQQVAQLMLKCAAERNFICQTITISEK